jgi:membrane-associated protease RseP (regulator of RpoE activity)
VSVDPAHDEGAGPPPPWPYPRPARGERPSGATTRLLLLVAAVLAAGWAWGLSVVVVIACLIAIVFLHELGHYVTAKAAGMKVTEFFIGFGPRIFSFRRGETEYGLKCIPAGAYVRIIGMTNLEEVPAEDEGRTYRQAPYWRRMSVALAGSTMHFLLAIILAAVLLAGFGVAHEDDWQVGELARLTTGESPAQSAGLQLGDRVLAVDDTPIPGWEELVDELRSRPGQQVQLTIERDGDTFTTPVTLASSNPDGEPVGFLGIGPAFPRQREPVPTAIAGSVGEVGRAVRLSVEGLGKLFSPSGLSSYYDNVLGRTPDQVDTGNGGTATSTSDDSDRPTSVVGIVRVASQAADTGVGELLALLVFFNAFIGVFNLIPLLPFDGGHVAVATYERIRSRRGKRYFADVNKLLPLTYGVVAVLVVLFLSSTYLDIADPMKNPFQN